MRRIAPSVIRRAAMGLLAIGLAGCGSASDRTGPDASSAAGPRLARVVCTVGMVADIVRAVAGDHAQVDHIIGEGVDPHLYRPTRSDVIALDRADIVFYSGLLLEGRMQDTLVRTASGEKPVHAVTRLIDPDYLLEPPGFGGHPDPHVWMDVAGWIRAVDAVAQALGEDLPEHAPEFNRNAEAYRAELTALDDYAHRVIGSVPESRRVLITAHDAFNYFGRAYGIDVRGIQGISTESEAGLEDINRLVDLIVERGIAAVFVETSVADKNVRALVEGAAARGHALRIGGTLFSDAMGAPGTYEGTYIGMIDHNATTIARALGGSAPARGMQGRLAGADDEPGDRE